jgi:hypothetical protein
MQLRAAAGAAGWLQMLGITLGRVLPLVVAAHVLACVRAAAAAAV